MNETRTVTYQPSKTVVTWSDVNKVYTTIVTPNRIGLARNRSGESCSMHKKLIREGNNATTNFNGVKRCLRWKNGSGYVCTKNTFYSPDPHTNTVTGNYFPVEFSAMAPDNTGTATANNLALMRMHKQVREVYTQAQSMIFLAEVRQTLRMIKHPANSIFDGFSDYLRGIKKFNTIKRNWSRKKKLDYAAGSWLEYSFGWRPLINDVADAVKAYERLGKRTPMTEVRASGVVEKYLQSTVRQVDVGGWNYILEYSKKHQTTIVTYYGAVRSRNDISVDSRFAELAGFTVSEFIPTVWEVIPWSFAVDYFTNIGNILEASATNTSGIAWMGCTTRRSVVKLFNGQYDVAKIKSTIPTTFQHAGGDPGMMEHSEVVVNRGPSTLTVPGFQLTVPGSPQKWINLAALAILRRDALKSF